MKDIKKINCENLDCPMPLIETRKAILAGEKGDRVEIVGTHESSKKEIPLALESMNCHLISIEQEDNVWKILFEI